MKPNLKKILLAPVLLLASLFSMISCDSFIASSLEGTWSGDMYVVSHYNGHYYKSTGCNIEFIGDPMSMHSGYGYWVDYYSGAPWDYMAYHIRWTVDNRVIYVHFLEDDYRLEIHDYNLDDRRFYGNVYYDGEHRYFELYHTSSPNWDNFHYYDRYDYGYGYGYGPYYAPSANPEVERKVEAADSVPAAPVRHMRLED